MRQMKVTDRNAAILRARELRRSMTPPERKLWQVLRTRPGGLKFRKQHPFGLCTADFYCPAARLVIEVDGDSHDMGDRPEHDARRDSWLRGQGFSVIRFLAADVMRNTDAVVRAILLAAGRS
jgi:very-short-patch-repair endonuclease